MNAEQQASIAIKRFLGPLKVLLELGDQFDSLGSIKQAITEAEARLEVLRQKEAKFFQDNEKAKAKAAADLSQLNDLISTKRSEIGALQAEISSLSKEHEDRTRHLHNVQKRLEEIRAGI